MKFEVEIEATPAEARAFLGLPDLTPLHDAWIERMKSFTIDGASRRPTCFFCPVGPHILCG